jgi:ubiquinone/menaquinone biosynthesis C-methylase UbiE
VNYKLLFPTYRTRQRWVLSTLDAVARTNGGRIRRMANVGCGEGDLDRELKERCDSLVACDINGEDVAHARALNADLDGISYEVADAERLPFPDASFDVTCCLEVIEHVSDTGAVMRELVRITRPGGHVVLTCPSARFPLTYDPLNWVLARMPAARHVSFGAFGYGHSWLVDEAELARWGEDAGLRLLDSTRMSHALASFVEAYWPGLVQKVLKANARNTAGSRRVLPSVRPSRDEPPGLALADRFIDLDERLFATSEASVSLGFLFARD